MRVIHDLKNPSLAIKQIAIDTDLPDAQVRREVCAESEDALEMLENLRVMFKVRHSMEFNEEPKNINVSNYLFALKRTHSKLALNCSNSI